SVTSASLRKTFKSSDLPAPPRRRPRGARRRTGGPGLARGRRFPWLPVSYRPPREPTALYDETPGPAGGFALPRYRGDDMQRTESPPLAARDQLGGPTKLAFGALALAALAIGGIGGWATYQNLVSSTGSWSNAASVVMFGEGGVFLASAVAIGRARL